MLLRTVIGSLVFTFVSAADWTVEILSCDESPSCESAVTYIPGETFGAFVSEPQSDVPYTYDLVLDVTNTTTLKLLSAGSCLCPGFHNSSFGYLWFPDTCFLNR